MPADAKPRGRLIAVDGARGREIERKAEDVRRRMKRRTDVRAAISRWDASGAFYELRAGGKRALTLTPRMLLLVYASDLAFRLRWEIQPSRDEGRTVIAAPYVETAVAFGEAAGLSRKWVVELLHFAPRADVCVSAGGTKNRKPPKGPAMDGFAEFAAAAAKTLRRGTLSKPSKDR